MNLEVVARWRTLCAVAQYGRAVLPCSPVGNLDLMGVAEIAVRLGLSKSRARQIAGGRGFPAPAARLVMGDVWESADVEEWIARHRPPVADDGAGT
jgi:prophage regulatory protein